MLIGWMSGSGQNFVRLADQSGYNISQSDLTELENLSNKIVDSLPSTFRNSFRVYDFSYYLYNEIMEGPNSFDNIWINLTTTVKENRDKPYYLLFGTEISSSGSSKTRVIFNLPSEGSFSCMLPIKSQIIKGKMEYILNESENIVDNKKKALLYLRQQIIQITDCCIGNRTECSNCLSVQELEDALAGFDKLDIDITTLTSNNVVFNFAGKSIDYNVSKLNFKQQASQCFNATITDEFLNICNIENISSINQVNSDSKFVFIKDDLGVDFLFYDSKDENDYFINEFYNFMLFDLKPNKNPMSDDYFDSKGMYLGGSDGGTGKIMIVETIPADLETKSFTEKISYFKAHCKDFQQGSTKANTKIATHRIAEYYYKNYIDCKASIKLVEKFYTASGGCSEETEEISHTLDSYITYCKDYKMAIRVSANYFKGNYFDPRAIENKYDLLTVFYHEQHHIDFDVEELKDGKIKNFVTERFWQPPSFDQNPEHDIDCGEKCPIRHLEGAYWAGVNCPFYPLTSEKFKKDHSDNILEYINSIPKDSSKNKLIAKFQPFIKN